MVGTNGKRFLGRHHRFVGSYAYKSDKLVEGLDADEASRLRAEHKKDYEAIEKRQDDPGLLNCVAECQAVASSEQVACMQAAETATVLTGCMSL